MQSNLRTHDATLITVARVLAEEPDGARLALALSEKVANLLQVQQVLVGSLVNYEIVVEHLGGVESRPLMRRFGPHDEAIGYVITHRRTYFSPQATHDPLLSQRYLEEFGCHTLLAVPILNHQRHLLGVIEVHNRLDGAALQAEDVATLEAIALLAAPAVERAQFFNKLGAWANSVANLMAFNAALNRHLDPPKLIRRLVEHAAGFLGASSGYAGLVQNTQLTADGYWAGRRWHPFQGCWQPQQGLPGWVYFNECTYLTNNYRDDALADPYFVNERGVVAALCVPIMDAHEQVLGFFELHNKNDGREPFTWSDAQFMESLANTTAVAIRNSLLLQEVEANREQLRALAARNATLLEDERHRLARELHDETGQALIGVKLNLQVLTRKIPRELPELRAEVDRLRQQINESAAQIKGIAHNLRPPTLDELGLQVALQQLMADFERRTTIAAHFSVANVTTRLPAAVETACFRVTQEALTNIARHAQATQVCISLAVRHQQVELIIGDNGCGFALTQLPNAGLGLLGMRERTLMLGGILHIRSAPGHGTTIEAVIPFESPR